MTPHAKRIGFMPLRCVQRRELFEEDHPSKVGRRLNPPGHAERLAELEARMALDPRAAKIKPNSGRNPK